jgi:hypothetical protein
MPTLIHVRNELDREHLLRILAEFDIRAKPDDTEGIGVVIYPSSPKRK